MTSLDVRTSFKPGDHTTPPWPRPSAPRVAILLCTFNRARYLPAQLASLEHQTHRNWHLIVSDDGSTDDTLTIIAIFAQRVSQPVEIREGPEPGTNPELFDA